VGWPTAPPPLLLPPRSLHLVLPSQLTERVSHQVALLLVWW
jgi:hypothetical protein